MLDGREFHRFVPEYRKMAHCLLINYHKATLMFKCINNLAPEYLCSMFNSINENCPYGLRSAQSNNLQVPHPKSELLQYKRSWKLGILNLKS
jgi:hypothetical protein